MSFFNRAQSPDDTKRTCSAFTISTTDPATSKDTYDDGGDATFLSQSSSAYTVDSRCEFVNVKQTCKKTMKKLRADEKKMKLREEDAAVRTALCDAGIKPEDLEHDCGLGSCRPRSLNSCANIKMFIFALCVFSTLSGMMIPGYLNSVITTIETRFQIGSSISGNLLVLFNDIFTLNFCHQQLYCNYKNILLKISNKCNFIFHTNATLYIEHIFF